MKGDHTAPGIINIQLEMRALDAEMEGMKAENEWRTRNGDSIAYGEEAFSEMAEKYRKLKESSKPEVVHEGLAKSIRHFGLGPTTSRWMEECGVKLISDIVKLTPKELRAIHLIGRTKAKKIEYKLTEMGLKLKEIEHA